MRLSPLARPEGFEVPVTRSISALFCILSEFVYGFILRYNCIINDLF